MGFRDKNIEYYRKRKRYNAQDLNAIISNSTSGIEEGGQTPGITAAEVAGVGIIGWVMAAGEILTGGIPVPCDLDPKFEVGFRVGYTANPSAGSATASWILLQTAIKEGIAIAVPTAVLDTIIALLDAYADDSGDATVTTDWLVQWTGRGIRNSIGLTREEIENGAWITISLELDAVANMTAVHFAFLEIDYVPMVTVGSGRETDSPLASAEG